MNNNSEADKEISPKDHQSEDESSVLSAGTDESTYRREDNTRIQSMISNMSELELQRYETFRRSGFPKGPVKKYINQVVGQAVNPNFVIAVNGLAKVFVGEMVEMARTVQAEAKEDGPLLPSHIHEAYRRLYKMIPNTKVFKRAPWD